MGHWEKRVNAPESYLGPSQTSMTELFVKIVNG